MAASREFCTIKMGQEVEVASADAPHICYV